LEPADLGGRIIRMEYIGIFDVPPLAPVLLSVVQAVTLFVLVILGLKVVGRRVFGEQSPQDLILLLLIAEACDLGLSDERAGYWGTVASVLTILFLGWLSEKIPFIRKLIDCEPTPLYYDGKLDLRAMKKNMIDEDDLNVTAREYGLGSYREFSCIMLEGDGKLTGVTPQVYPHK